MRYTYIADGVDVWKLDKTGKRVKWIGRMDEDAARVLARALNERQA